MDAEFQKFSVDMRSAPKRICIGDFFDKCDDAGMNMRATLSVFGFGKPITAKSGGKPIYGHIGTVLEVGDNYFVTGEGHQTGGTELHVYFLGGERDKTPSTIKTSFRTFKGEEIVRFGSKKFKGKYPTLPGGRDERYFVPPGALLEGLPKDLGTDKTQSK